MAKKTLDSIFTHQFLSDWLSTASYGNPWFAFGTHQDTPKEVYQAAKNCYTCSEDIWAYNLLHGGYLLVEDVEEEEDYKISLDDIKEGFKTFMLDYPQQYANLMEEQEDLWDADCLLQVIIFGELTYG